MTSQAKSSRKTVVFGLLGTTLDHGLSAQRWSRWRPTVSLAMQEDLVVDRFELIHDLRFTKLAQTVAADIRSCSQDTEVVLHVRDFEDPWDFEEVYTVLHGFASEYAFDPEHEDYLIHITTGTHVAQICLFLLAETRYLPGRLLQAVPATPRGSGPGTVQVIDLDLSRYDRLASRFERELHDALESLKGGIATRNVAFNRLIERIETVAIRTTDPILLMGPTGAGKSRLAGRIHELRCERGLVGENLVEVNCATLRGDLAMSTLFGHERGAFSGASSARPGLLRAADGGALFLDEIGELGLDEQAMLLRAVEKGSFLPVGADREVSSAFQLLAGTNRDLRERVREGAFREDLLARIDLWSFELPALRDRTEDIEPNLDHELERFSAHLGKLVSMSREARESFLAFAAEPASAWSGNFRDLGAAVTRMATLAPGGRIDEETVAEEVGRLKRSWSGRSELPGGSLQERAAALLGPILGEEGLAELDPFDRAQLAGVVELCRSSASLSEAGRRLFAVSRTQRASTNDSDRLRKYLARHNLRFSDLA